MLSDNVLYMITVFLKTYSDGNIINIRKVKNEAYLKSLDSTFGIGNCIVFECHCKDDSNFGKMDNLEKVLYAVFKGQLSAFNKVRIEYSYSTYSVKD
jgi:hypothetical protein